ncbi:MAG TPA: hypothetical protein VK536_00625 [Candidatus Limnocylindrales bacterium]|nr:hypothetical protein [Candidatus Limnocylindrales bacterium]
MKTFPQKEFDELLEKERMLFKSSSEKEREWFNLIESLRVKGVVSITSSNVGKIKRIRELRKEIDKVRKETDEIDKRILKMIEDNQP